MNQMNRVQVFLQQSMEARSARNDAVAADLMSQAVDLAAETRAPLPRSIHYDLGVLLYQTRRYGEAERRLREALRRHPKDYQVTNLLGVVLKQQGRFAEALQVLEQARRLNPGALDYFVNAGNIHLAMRDGPRAVELFAKACRLLPRSSEYQRLPGMAHWIVGDLEKAARQLETARRLDPKNARAWRSAAILTATRGYPDEALALLDRALALTPDHDMLLKAKMEILRRAGRIEIACDLLLGLLAVREDVAWVHAELADTLEEIDRPRANEHFRRAVELDPDDRDTVVKFMESLLRTRKVDEAANLQHALSLAHRLLDAGGDLLPVAKSIGTVLMRCCDHEGLKRLPPFDTLGTYFGRSTRGGGLHNMLPQAVTPALRRSLVEHHRLWGRHVTKYAAGAPLVRPGRTERRGKIRVGLMSSDLRRHPVSYFVLPLIERYDRQRFEFYCYSFFTGQADPIQQRISSLVEAFRLKPMTPDRDIAQMIAADDVDILFELGGATDMNKLEPLAWRPAPIQVSWLGYPHSSGLPQIDRIIVDPYLKPTDPTLLIEKPMTLAHSWVSLGDLGFNDRVPIDPLTPEERTGRITFGTMNNPMKYSPGTLAAWAEVVRAVEGSRFLFVRPEGDVPAFVDNVLAAFEAGGVSRDRVDFIPVRGQHLQHYNAIDIALDTFPQTGGTTTCECLWMGVPVVTLVGEAFFERLSYSNLNNAALGDLCAFDRASYVAKAVALAADDSRRRMLRRTLRQALRALPLGDVDLFARDFQGSIETVVAGG